MELLQAAGSIFFPCWGDPSLAGYCSGSGLLQHGDTFLFAAWALASVVSFAAYRRYSVFAFYSGLALLLLFNGLAYQSALNENTDFRVVFLLAAALMSVLMGLFRVARRVAMRAFPVAVLFGLLGWAIYLALAPDLDPDNSSDLRIIQAIIAGALVASGWIVTFSIQELRAEQARKQQEEEMMIALAYEILDELQAKFVDWETFGEGFQKILDEPEPSKPHRGPAPSRLSKLPFFHTASEKTVFNAMTSDVHVLPKVALSKIIKFYSLFGDYIAITDDLRAAVTHSLPNDRLARLYLDAYEIRRTLREDGLEALRAINSELGVFREIKFKDTEAYVTGILDKGCPTDLTKTIEDLKDRL